MNNQKNIVIIEDDKVLRELTQMALSLEGYNIQSFENGQIGIRYLTENLQQVDLVLLDLFMPVLDGVHVLNWLRKEQQSKVYVVVMTAMSDKFTEKNILESGADKIIKKPLDMQTLLTNINGLLAS